MNGTKASATKPANDRHILAYPKTVLAKLGLEGTNHEFRHSFRTIAERREADRTRTAGKGPERLAVPPATRELTPAPNPPGAAGRQHRFSKVMEVNDDTLFKEPWIPA